MAKDVVVLFCLGLLLAAVAAPSFAAESVQPVQLPYVLRDSIGSNWDVQYDGSIGDGGNDLYDGGGRLMINNVGQYQSPNQQAMLDQARNELSFPPVMIGAVNVSRRVTVLPALGAVRFTEIFENPGAAPVKVPVRCYFNMGGAVQQAIPLTDPKRPRHLCGYAIGDGNNAVAMIAMGRTPGKTSMLFNSRMNDDNVDIYYDVEVPAHKTVAVVHVQLRRRTATEAAEAWQDIRDKQLTGDLPRDLRRKVVNFPGGDAMVGDVEILRGDAQDVVELRGGDAYRGTIKVDQFRLQTLYGPVTLKAERVVGIVNVGTYRPSQMVVTTDGDVFGGRLDVDAIKLQLSGGQLTSIPLSRVTRIGFRKRPGEPEEWDFENKAVAYLRGGERLRVRVPTADFNLATMSGPIRLNPAVISSIVFQGEDVTVPEVHLTDGTRLSALLGTDRFEMTLAAAGVSPAGGSAEQRVRLPAAAMARMTFAPEQEPDHLTSSFTLANGDTLIGTLGGTLSLETPFDVLHVEGPQVKSLTHAKGGDHDVTLTLWDDSTLSGRLVESHVSCALRCGVGLRVPVTLIERYAQPLPMPSESMAKQIRQIARDLDSERWPVRDRAQAKILAIGPPVMSVLKQIQPTAPAEVAQRIEVILGRLAKQLEAPGAAGGAGPDGEGGGGIINDGQILIFER